MQRKPASSTPKMGLNQGLRLKRRLNSVMGQNCSLQSRPGRERLSKVATNHRAAKMTMGREASAASQWDPTHLRDTMIRALPLTARVLQSPPGLHISSSSREHTLFLAMTQFRLGDPHAYTLTLCWCVVLHMQQKSSVQVFEVLKGVNNEVS